MQDLSESTRPAEPTPLEEQAQWLLRSFHVTVKPSVCASMGAMSVLNRPIGMMPFQ